MKRWFMAILILLTMAGCSLTPSAPGGEQGSPQSYQQISMSEATAMMKEQDVLILDVRTPQEYAEGHIPKAVNVPNETIGTDPIPALPEKDKTILVYCRSGNRSKQAAQKLAAQGYTAVYEFGGIKSWQGAIEK